jgi:putative peptide zinc metalloprotease protein
MYTRDTVIRVLPFTRQQDGQEVIIGRIETGVFLAVPSEALEVLDNLAQGKTIGEAADLYQQEHGEIADLDDFLRVLETKGIISPMLQSVNGDAAIATASHQRPRVRYHFSNFPHRLAQCLFSRPVLAGCFTVIVLALAARVRDPSLLPRPRDLYFPDRRAVTWAILIVASYVTIFFHELGHLISARALGINSRIGISNRLWYLVAETDLTGLWAVPKRQRYLPMLAGVLIDTVSASLLTLLVFAREQEWVALSSLAVRLARGMMFTYVMRILWQFFLFVRTDFYYVIASLLNCKNLLKDTEGFLRNQLARIVPFIHLVDQSAIPETEGRIIRAYSIVWVAGRLFALTVLFLVTLPLAVLYIRNLRHTFSSGFRASPSDFVDALLLASYFIIPLTVGLVMWFGNLMRRGRT